MENYSKEPMIIRSLTEAEAPSTRLHQGIPSITRLPSGRMFTVYYGGPLKGEGPGNYVILSTSTDNGLTWKECQIVPPDGRPNERAFDPEIWVAPDGALWLFWAQSYSPELANIMDGRAGVWAARCASPDVDSPSWEEPRRLGEGIMMCKPIVMQDGTWLLPASLWSCYPDKVPDEFKPIMGANVFLSYDNGKTFETVPGPKIPTAQALFDEHMVVQRQDGSLWMLIRTNYGVYQSESTDNGRSWSPITFSRMSITNSRFVITRLSSGNLLFVHHLARMTPPQAVIYGERAMLTAWLSKDNGRTWPFALTLDERDAVSYPSCVEGEDGFIYVTYDHERLRTGQILLSRFKEADLEAGEFVTPGAYRQLLISSFGTVRE